MTVTNNLFDKITFDTTGINTNGGSIPKFIQVSNDENPKATLLNDVSSAIDKKEKLSLRNHTIGKAKAKIIQLQAGEKTRKIFNTKIHPSATKTSLRNQTNLGMYSQDQNISLLKKLQTYLKQDKSEKFDFDKFNEFVSKTYEHYQDKVSLLAMSQELEMREKKASKISNANNPLDSVAPASQRLKEHKANMKKHEAANPWPESNFTKLTDFVTESLLLSPIPKKLKTQNNKEIDANSDNSVAANLVESVKSKASVALRDHNTLATSRANQTRNNSIGSNKDKGR